MTITTDKNILYGYPHLEGRRLEPWHVVSSFKAGDSIAAVCEDYEITQAEMEECLRFELGVRHDVPMCGTCANQDHTISIETGSEDPDERMRQCTCPEVLEAVIGVEGLRGGVGVWTYDDSSCKHWTAAQRR